MSSPDLIVRRSRIATVCGSLLIALATMAATSGAQAQTYELHGGGISQEQIERGQGAFMANCAGCHGDDLRSIDSNAPDLRGPTFKYGWADAPLSEKFDKIATTMPPGMGGSLSDQTYADIVAFILSVNGVEPSGEDLPGDAGALETYVVSEP